MNVDVMVNGRQWKVALEPGEQTGTFTVTIKGKSRVVDASWVDADTLSLIDGGAAREIRLHPRDENSAVGVEFGGKLYETVASTQKREMGPLGAIGATGALGAASIKAPMPGRVVRVLVTVGDRVTAKQAVVVVEAMKMENELRTPRDGIVKEVLVIPGAAVESGAVLVVVDQ
jgi:acetyl/propionyl-CoA carboxylase alpha subunit